MFESDDEGIAPIHDAAARGTSGARALGPGREFDLVRDFVRRWGPIARGIGGDCAELAVPAGERLLASTDSSVEDVHFRRAWLEPREIGYRAAAAALSDLAAAAARPLGLLLALTVPDRWRGELAALADGVGEAARLAECPIVGGDLTGGATLCITVTVLGSTARPLHRGGARKGDALFVTGRLGAPAAALRAWLDGSEPAPAHRERFAYPVPRLREARWLAEHGATAMMDLSDGLVSDLRHIAAASAVRIELDTDGVPRAEGSSMEDALAGGEEYELIVAAPEGTVDVRAFERAFGVPLTMIGRVAEHGAPSLDARVDLPGGYDHFSP